MASILDVLSNTAFTVEQQEASRFNRYRFIISAAGNELVRGTHFTGSQYIQPWIEVQPADGVSPTQDCPDLIRRLLDVLEPGSHIMVHYLEDSETAEALTADVPAPATALGHLLWRNGCRWYKDWYFTEGWMEGDQKLQGNLPVSAEHRHQQETRWADQLAAFLEKDTAFPACTERAQQILADIRS